MAIHDYHFITEWRMQASVDEVLEILGDASALTRWWCSVYLDFAELERKSPADPAKPDVGRRFSLYTKGWLPYTLRWEFEVTESNRPHGFTIAATGDFVGRGIWTFKPDGEWVNITYDWKIQAEKPLLKYLTFVLKPIFSMNHHWAMEKGEESLRLEILRRRAKTDQERNAIPAPPAPTPTSLPKWLVYVIAHRK